MTDAQSARVLADRARDEADATTSLPRHAYLAGVEDALRWVVGEDAPDTLARLLDEDGPAGADGGQAA